MAPSVWRKVPMKLLKLKLQSSMIFIKNCKLKKQIVLLVLVKFNGFFYVIFFHIYIYILQLFNFFNFYGNFLSEIIVNIFNLIKVNTKNEVWFLQQMWPNPQEAADLVTFTGEIRNGKLHFEFSARQLILIANQLIGFYMIGIRRL